MAEKLNMEALIRKIRSYNPTADTELIRRAFWFSSEAHGRQTRKEGTEYISHPLEVAYILAEMKMDSATIAAAILHDTIEDTLTSAEDIQKRFGFEIAFLVKALTKLNRLEFKTRADAQAENFRKMFLSMSEDIRVIMIKFADRLHNLRTLGYLPDKKRLRIASETLDIYAPIANRLGIGWLKTEFEELSFKYLMPELHEELAAAVARKRGEQEGYVKKVIGLISKKLKDEEYEVRVSGRVKHLYGIYQKMQQRKLPFEQIHDVLGIRIICDTKASCYGILGLIHSLWKPIPGRFHDYIGVPKSNMYQSLHSTIIGPGGERVEFQIRTDEMDRVSEEGIAAHWRYKDKGRIDEKDDRYISWLRDLVQAQGDTPDAADFVEAVKGEVIPDVIYIFTPQGDIKELPAGSTPIDFAYSIHTEVGNQCTGAKVNGRLVPLHSELKSGDTVEINRTAAHTPSRDWLKYVVTPKARSRIKHWVKDEERKQSRALGVQQLEKELRKNGMSPKLIKSAKMQETAGALSFKDTEELLVAVGYGKLTPLQVIHKLMPERVQAPEPPAPQRRKKEHKGVLIKGVDDILYHIGKCCHPVPGDTLAGLITIGRGVTVHRRDCKNIERFTIDDERLVPVEWKESDEYTSYGRIVLETMDRPGILANLTAAISAMEINIHKLEAVSTAFQRSRITFTAEVKGRSELQSIVRKLSQMDGVFNVRRG